MLAASHSNGRGSPNNGGGWRSASDNARYSLQSATSSTSCRVPVGNVVVLPTDGDETRLNVGDVVVYQFVTPDHRWHWSVGTVHSLSFCEPESDNSKQVVPYADRMLVTVKEWAMINPHDNACKVSGTLPVDHGSVATTLASTHACGRQASERALATIPLPLHQTAETERMDYENNVAGTECLLEVARDALCAVDRCHWEHLCRCPSTMVPSGTRLVITAMLHLLGYVDRHQSGCGRAEWDTAVRHIQGQQFLGELECFSLFAEEMTGDDRQKGKGASHREKLDQRVHTIRCVLANPFFRYEDALKVSLLTGRVYKWLSAQLRYYDAVTAYHQTGASQDRASKGRSSSTTHAHPPMYMRECYHNVSDTVPDKFKGFTPDDGVLFLEGATLGTTTRSSIFAKLVSDDISSHFVLRGTQMDEVRSAMVAPGVMKRATAAKRYQMQDFRRKEQHPTSLSEGGTTRPTVSIADMIYRYNRCRDSLRHQEVEALYDYHVENSVHHTKLTGCEMKLSQRAKVCVYQITLLMREEEVCRLTVARDQDKALQAIIRSLCENTQDARMLRHAREQAEEAEWLRLRIRGKRSQHLRAADTVGSVMKNIVEHPRSSEADAQRLLDAVEEALNALEEDADDDAHCVVAPLPSSLRDGPKEGCSRVYSSSGYCGHPTSYNSALVQACSPSADSSHRNNAATVEDATQKGGGVAELSQLLQIEQNRRIEAEYRLEEMEKNTKELLGADVARLRSEIASQAATIRLLREEANQFQDAKEDFHRKLRLLENASTEQTAIVSRLAQKLKARHTCSSRRSDRAISSPLDGTTALDSPELACTKAASRLMSAVSAPEGTRRDKDEEIEDLEQLLLATADALEASLFHDERWWPLKAVTDFRTKHTKRITGQSWQDAAIRCPDRLREFAIRDIARAAHLSEDYVQDLSLEPTNFDLLMTFYLRHDPSVSESELGRRLEESFFIHLKRLHDEMVQR